MNGKTMSRRELLQAATLMGTASVVSLKSAKAKHHNATASAPMPGRTAKVVTTPLTPNEMAAIEAALGKKGAFVEAEGVGIGLQGVVALMLDAWLQPFVFVRFAGGLRT